MGSFPVMLVEVFLITPTIIHGRNPPIFTPLKSNRAYARIGNTCLYETAKPCFKEMRMDEAHSCDRVKLALACMQTPSVSGRLTKKSAAALTEMPDIESHRCFESLEREGVMARDNVLRSPTPIEKELGIKRRLPDTFPPVVERVGGQAFYAMRRDVAKRVRQKRREELEER